MRSANQNSSFDECEKGEAKPDTIALGSSFYQLSIPSSDEDLNADGDLDYTGGGPLTIRGDSTIDAVADDRVLESVTGTRALKLQRLTLVGGDVSGLDGTSNANGGALKVIGGNLRLTRALVVEGRARVGGGLYFASGSLVIDRTTFSYNDAIQGAGIHTLGDGTARISRSIFHNNDAVDGAARGGAISSGLEPTTITDSTIRDNTTSSDGGGSSLGAGVLALGGGLVIRRTLIANNHAEEEDGSVGAGGGGVFGFDKNKIVNSTFYDNSSADEGGGLSGEAQLAHVTFLSNEAVDTGDHIYGASDGVTVRNSLLPGASIAVDLCGGLVQSGGFSAATYDDASCGFLDSDAFGDVALANGEPANNGGRTLTVGIQGSSIAKDLVPNRKCKVAGGEDQRGFERPAGKRCDAGAFERGAKP
jgi:hypothetical protein